MSYRAQLGELDISEEAEELREFLYDIVNGYPAGIDSKLLEDLYREKYVETGISKSLPKDWLRQLQLAGEFEIKSAAGLTTVYIVHKGGEYTIPTADVAPIDPIQTEADRVQEVILTELKEALPDVQQTPVDDNGAAESSSPVEENANTAEVLSADGSFVFCYVRYLNKKHEFDEFVKLTGAFYTEHHKDADLYVETLEKDQVYAVLDNVGSWCRVIVKGGDDQSTILSCFFVDTGEIKSIVRRSLKKLDPGFNLEAVPPFIRCCAVEKLSEAKATRLPHVIANEEILSVKKMEPLKIKLHIVQTVVARDYDIVYFEDDSGKKQNMEYIKTLQNTDMQSSTKAPALPAPVPVSDFTLICRDPEEMPNKKEIVHIISATDPDNISIQLATWHPAPAYLAAAMTRDSENSQSPAQNDVKIGNFYAAKLEEAWERVQIIRQSSTVQGGDYWVVYAVDMGNFHLIPSSNLRFLTESVSSFNKILLAKCQLAGIKGSETGVWSREIQQAMQDLLLTSSTSVVEFLPAGEWSKKSVFNAPNLPYASGQLFIDGKDLGQQLVSMGLAQPVN